MMKQEHDGCVLEVFLNQVGGHSLLIKRKGSDQVMKPVKMNELNFYKFIYGERSEEVKRLQKFLPAFHGSDSIRFEAVQEVTPDSLTKKQWLDHLLKKRFSAKHECRKVYIRMEDLTSGLQYPCILDLKMGFKPVHQKDVAKYDSSTSAALGFRICGMNINQPNGQQVFKDKYWGRAITHSKLKYCLAAFFYDAEASLINLSLVHNFVEQLKQLNAAIAENMQFRWTSSSLLLIYEGSQPSMLSLKLIDFENVQLVEGSTEPDEAMVQAIHNLISTLQDIDQIQHNFSFNQIIM